MRERNKQERIKDAGDVLYKILLHQISYLFILFPVNSPSLNIAFRRYADPIFLSAAKAKAAQTAKSASLPGKPRVQQVTNQKSKLAVSQPNSPSASASKSTSKSGSASSTPRIVGKSNMSTDLEGLHLNEEMDEAERKREKEKFKERQVLSMKQEELIAKAKEEEEKSGKKNVSLIVVGMYTRSCAIEGCLLSTAQATSMPVNRH